MTDEEWMDLALAEAKTGFLEDEVPVGAVLIKDERCISKAHNLCRQKNDPTAHAELLALQEGQRLLGSLAGCTLYVTLEPCAMCAGAMVNLRLPRLVYGARDALCGCAGSCIDLTDHWFQHSVETWSGVRQEPCADLLSAFFQGKR